MKFHRSCLGLLLALGLAGQTVPVETYPMVGDLSMPLVMQQGADGTVWVGATSGLYRVAGGKLIPARGGPTASSVVGIEEFGGSLWLGTLSGIFRWTDGKMEFVHPGAPFGLARQGKNLYFTLVGQAGLRRMDLEACVGRTGCQSVLIDARATWRPARGADGRLWFPCGKQICAFDEKLGSGGIERRGREQGVPELEWQKCLSDRQGALWALTATGTYRQLPGESELSSVTGMLREGSQSDTLDLDAAGDAFASGPDWVWLGGRRKFFSTVTLGLGEFMINAQLGDRSGGMWFALKSGQLARLKSGGKVEVWSEREGFDPISLNHLLMDDGTEWCSSRSKIAYLRPGGKAWQNIAIPGKKGRVRLFKAGPHRLIAELPDDRIFEIDTDSSKAQQRKVEEIHTDGPSLVLPIGEDLLWIRKTRQEEERIPVKLLRGSRAYRSFVEDRQGRLWFVTNKGLVGVNRDGTTRLFTAQDGLRMNALQTAELDLANDLWVGYDTPSDISVVKLPVGAIGERTVLDFSHITPARIQESVFTFGFDLQNRLWKGTDLGMLVTDARPPGTLQWLTMGEGDGLPHPDIVMNSFLRFPDGSLGFNTLKGRVRVYEPVKLFQPGQRVSVNGVLEDGIVKLATMPAEAASHVKLEYRKWSWFESWKTVPGLEFAVGRDVEGIEVRVVDNYFYKGAGSLKLGEEHIPKAAWWLLGGLLALLGGWFRVLDNLWFRWQKKHFVAPLDVPQAVVEDLLPGTLLKDRFQIGKVLARGSFSDVYEALDTAHEDSRVVVKRLKLPEFGGDFSESWLKRRFMQEVGAATMLRHPGVLPIIEAWIESRSPETATPYLVMRRVEGPTLRSYLNEHGRLKPDRALGWLKQLGEVMKEAHSRGIIHCDLKPENIMLEPDGESFRLLVIDFGTSALCLESEVMSKQTRPVGTATYMAPEQLMGSYSAASDLYAFALISLEMLSGVQYRELEIRFDDNWEKDLQIALGKLGLTINTAQVFVRGLRFVPQQRDQSLAKWVLSLEASLLEQ